MVDNAMTPKVEIFGELDAVESDASGALGREAQPCLFDRLEWYRLVDAHCPPPGKLKVARAQSDRARAWLFLAMDGKMSRSSVRGVPFRVVVRLDLHE